MEAIVDVEALGYEGPDVDAEMIVMSARLWKELGIDRIRLEINSLGVPVDDKGPIEASETSPIEKVAPGVIARQSVRHFNHIPGGGNVLYMDGHTEFQKYPGGKCFTYLIRRLLGNMAGDLPRNNE
mgnify:CR=1 FL=1